MSNENNNSRECQLLALLYRVEELLIELRDGGKDSQDYKDLTRIIKNLENYLVDQRDGLI
jgi:hypothetical protein